MKIKTTKNTYRCVLLIDPSLMLRAERLAPFLDVHDGLEVCRSDVMRVAMIKGLKALEDIYGVTAPISEFVSAAGKLATKKRGHGSKKTSARAKKPAGKKTRRRSASLRPNGG